MNVVSFSTRSAPPLVAVCRRRPGSRYVDIDEHGPLDVPHHKDGQCSKGHQSHDIEPCVGEGEAVEEDYLV